MAERGIGIISLFEDSPCYRWILRWLCKRKNDTDCGETEGGHCRKTSGRSNKKIDSSGQKTSCDNNRKKWNANIYIPDQIYDTESIRADFHNFFAELPAECKFMHPELELQDDAPLIVVCHAVSRLEPDVDYALNELQWSTRVAVIVLNVKRETWLPRLPIETRLQTEQAKYKDIYFIDVAYTPEDHLYNCEMNTEAKAKLRAFFNRMYQ